ncbi:MAG: DUF308 domain-containing protein [Akkermansia sp.]|nr:DUF308 domain-containing protein [Akkermansia sp.]
MAAVSISEMNASSIQNSQRVSLLASPWVTGTLAVLELAFGFILLGFPFLLGSSAMWVGGFVLLVLGIVRLVQGFCYACNRWWNILAGILFLCLGGLMVALPVLSLEVFTLVLGCLLLISGVLRLVFAVSLRHESGSGWRFFNGIVSLILGAMVLWQWPSSSLWLIGTLIAIEMIFSGWTLLFLALTPLRRS